MKLTRETMYALRLMEYMASKEKGIVVGRREVSENANIPSHFLAKIAQDLAKVGFIEIRRGSRGGFVLTTDPEKVTLNDIIEAMIGILDIGYHFNDDSNLGREINRINYILAKELAKVTLSRVVE